MVTYKGKNEYHYLGDLDKISNGKISFIYNGKEVSMEANEFKNMISNYLTISNSEQYSKDIKQKDTCVKTSNLYENDEHEDFDDILNGIWKNWYLKRNICKPNF